MNIFETLRKEKHEDENYPEKSWSVADLVRAFEKVVPSDSRIDRNKINRIENGSQSPDVATLIAYSKVFNVSVDYLLGLSPSRAIDENMKMICNYTGLSDESIQDIAKLNKDDKFILDKMIKNYCFLSSISDIRKLIAFRSLQPHVKVVFEEITNFEKGDFIDKELTDTINDKSTLHFFNENVTNGIRGVIENTICDDELEEYFKKIYVSSKIKGRPLTIDELARQMGISDETTKTSNRGAAYETT